MPQPVFEGWFMQGQLKPNYHYVLLKDDYSDLEEKIDYFASNTDEALYIINMPTNMLLNFSTTKANLLISACFRKVFHAFWAIELKET